MASRSGHGDLKLSLPISYTFGTSHLWPTARTRGISLTPGKSMAGQTFQQMLTTIAVAPSKHFVSPVPHLPASNAIRKRQSLRDCGAAALETTHKPVPSGSPDSGGSRHPFLKFAPCIDAPWACWRWPDRAGPVASNYQRGWGVEAQLWPHQYLLPVRSSFSQVRGIVDRYGWDEEACCRWNTKLDILRLSTVCIGLFSIASSSLAFRDWVSCAYQTVQHLGRLNFSLTSIRVVTP